MSFGNPSQDERRETILGELGARIREVQQGPDGLIYVATEQEADDSEPNSTVLRIEPVN